MHVLTSDEVGEVSGGILQVSSRARASWPRIRDRLCDWFGHRCDGTCGRFFWRFAVPVWCLTNFNSTCRAARLDSTLAAAAVFKADIARPCHIKRLLGRRFWGSF